MDDGRNRPLPVGKMPSFFHQGLSFHPNTNPRPKHQTMAISGFFLAYSRNCSSPLFTGSRSFSTCSVTRVSTFCKPGTDSAIMPAPIVSIFNAALNSWAVDHEAHGQPPTTQTRNH